MTKADFRNIMAVDKKVQDGRLRLILLKGPLGSCVVTGDFDPAAPAVAQPPNDALARPFCMGSAGRACAGVPCGRQPWGFCMLAGHLLSWNGNGVLMKCTESLVSTDVFMNSRL